jgi:hypothetical protein
MFVCFKFPMIERTRKGSVVFGINLGWFSWVGLGWVGLVGWKNKKENQKKKITRDSKWRCISAWYFTLRCVNWNVKCLFRLSCWKTQGLGREIFHCHFLFLWNLNRATTLDWRGANSRNKESRTRWVVVASTFQECSHPRALNPSYSIRSKLRWA